MGALWRSNGVTMLDEPRARALHPRLPTGFDPEDLERTAHNERWRLYALMFDAMIANPSPWRAVSYEVLGFLAGIKLYLRHPRIARDFVRSWLTGHRLLMGDRRHLRALCARELPSHG
jgi:hypothetical protein